mmetsp:Transcript_55057/g.101915  ORF Transcript_55057/g.101915 Transcript_55057/m.101915 type:complete len:520 (+) Transcript_55057:80-1639(+)
MTAYPPQSTKPAIRFRALEKVKVRAPSLVQICLKRVAENFLSYNNLEKKLARKQLEDVYSMLDLEMPLPEAAVRINDENYWKRRTQVTHRNAQVEKHGMSWKQTFLELELQDALERVTIDYGNHELEALKLQVQASRLYIFQLVIGQFPSHIDLSFLFDTLTALCSFSITYGNRRLGMDYERAMFGMKISDAQYLARNIRVSQTLVSLSLPCNMIDDELVKSLMGGLSYGHMLTHLDLSHNKVGDRGARRLASLLDPDYCLQSLDLCDNQIHANGCMHLGAHLAENMTCRTLNLRLNRCEDNGVSHLCQDLCVNKYLKSLNISCNDLTVRCLPYMNSMMAENTTLTDLDISANPLYTPADQEEGAATMDAAADQTLQPMGEGGMDVGGVSASSPLGTFARNLMNSPSLLRVDIRQCGLPAEVATLVGTAVKHRELRSKNIPVEAYEKFRQQQEAEAARALAEEEEEAEGEGGAGEAGEEGAAGATAQDENGEDGEAKEDAEGKDGEPAAEKEEEAGAAA